MMYIRLKIMAVVLATMWLLSICTTGMADFLEEALVGVWLFDEGDGGTAKDASGNGHDGEVRTPEWVAGNFGSALEFDGDDIVDIPHHEDFNLETYTIVAWVKVGSVRANFAQNVVGKDDPAGSPRNFGLYVDGDERRDVLGTNYTHGGAWQSEYGITPVMDEQWHHLAATRDGEFLRAYTDGVLEGESGATIPPDQNDESVKIGRWGAPRGDFIVGLIDEVAIFNRALTEEEIGLVITGLAAMLAVEPSGKLAVTWGYIRNDHAQ